MFTAISIIPTTVPGLEWKLNKYLKTAGMNEWICESHNLKSDFCCKTSSIVSSHHCFPFYASSPLAKGFTFCPCKPSFCLMYSHKVVSYLYCYNLKPLYSNKSGKAHPSISPGGYDFLSSINLLYCTIF